MNELLANKVVALTTALADQAESVYGPDRSGSSMGALQTLFHRGPLTATELARILGVSQPTTVKVIAGLIQEGLVRRRKRRARNVALALTPAGRTKTRRLERARLTEVSKLFSGIDAAQIRSFANVVDLLLAALTDGRATARQMCRFCDHAICDEPACPVGSRATVLEREL